MKLREAEEPSKSCTTMGRSLTVSERPALSSRSMTTGSTSASASVRQSRTIWVSSLRACAMIRLMADSYDLNGHLAFEARLFDDGDEDVFEREAVFAGADDVKAVRFELLRGLADGEVGRCRR